MGLLGGAAGLELLAQLAAVSLAGAVVALGLRRAPATWQPRLPDAAFALGLGLQLGWLARLALQPLALDVDSAQHAALLDAAPSLAEALGARGQWAADYILQTPLVYGLSRLLGVGALRVYLFLALAGAAATALVLRALARRLGADPWAASLAALAPLSSFGGGWIAASLDDNAFASALQWAAFLALVAAVARADGGGRLAPHMLAAGVLLGLAVSLHRKALLWLALVPLAPLAAAAFRSRRALAGLALALGAAAATHLLAAFLWLPGDLGRLLGSAHHRNPAWWFPAGEGGWLAQAGLVWDGLHASLVTFPLLRDVTLSAGPVHYLDLLVALALAAALAGAWRTRRLPAARLLGAGVALEAAHSVLYEPWSVERWDVALGGAAVLVAVAVSGPGRPARPWRAAAAWLWLMLLACQHLTLRWHPEFYTGR